MADVAQGTFIQRGKWKEPNMAVVLAGTWRTQAECARVVFAVCPDVCLIELWDRHKGPGSIKVGVSGQLSDIKETRRALNATRPMNLIVDVVPL